MTPSAVALRAGLDRGHWTSLDLWRAALGTGGAFTRQEVDLLLGDHREATASEHDILASVCNDRLHDLHDPASVPYWRELGD